MSKKIPLLLSTTVMFGAALVAPSAAFAQFGPPPGPPPALAGPPPGFGANVGDRLQAWAPAVLLLVVRPHLSLAFRPAAWRAHLPRDFAGGPPHFSHLDGAAGLHGLDRGEVANFRGVEGRAAVYSR